MQEETQSNIVALYTRKARILQGPPTQAAYEDILDRAANLRMRKVLSYGESRYKDPDFKHSLTILYADCYRKMVRLRAFIIEGKHEGEPLEETFLDLINFGAMGLQIYEQGMGRPEIELHDVEQMGSLGQEEAQEYLSSPTEDLSERIDQIALYSSDPASLAVLLGEVFGQKLEWTGDTVTAEGTLYEQKEIVNRAELAYNYQICGVEFEILHYTMGSAWQNDKSPHQPRVSHFGVHVDDLTEWESRMRGLGFKTAQSVVTTDHTNPVIKDTRRYSYQIWDTLEALGFYLKLIQRLPV